MDNDNIKTERSGDDAVLCEDITQLLVHRRDMSRLSASSPAVTQDAMTTALKHIKEGMQCLHQ